jgi:hypothetical protein
MTELTLELHELSFVPEGDQVVVGRLDTGTYVVLPVDGAALLEKLCTGMTSEAAADWYEREFGEPVDMADFVDTLHELGFVRDGDPVLARPVRFRRLGQVLFSPVAWFAYAMVIAVWLVLAVRHADLRPVSSQIFFTDSLVVVQLVVTFGQLPLLLLHEGFHILAGRRLGLPSQLRMSNRLFYVVFETTLNGLLSRPRRERYLPFLAGMLCDVVVLAGLGIVADGTRAGDGSLSFTGRLCLAMGFTVLVRLGWQLQLFLRTDLYFVFATALNCYDLHDASKALLRNRIWRWLGRPGRVVDENQWTEHDRRVGRWYGPFLALGVLTAIGLAAFATVPILAQYGLTLVRHLASGRLDGLFWDAAVSLAANLTQLVLALILAVRKRHPSSRPAVRLVAAEGAS